MPVTFAHFRPHQRTDGTRLLTDPAGGRVLYLYPCGRVATAGRFPELPTVPHSRNEREEAERQGERDWQRAVIAAAFEAHGWEGAGE